jgi:hypothetical protein
MGERLGASYGPKSSGSLKTFRNEPFGSRSEPDFHMTRENHSFPPGEIPEGRAGVPLQPTGPCAEAHSKARA